MRSYGDSPLPLEGDSPLPPEGESPLSLERYLGRLDDELCTWPTAPALFTRANANDQWPKPITPLTQDLVALPQERGLGIAFADELRVAVDHGPWTWNGTFYGWFTYAVEPAAAMADSLPGYSRAGVYGDYFGVSEDPDAPPPAPGRTSPLALAGIGARFVRALATYPSRSRRYRVEAETRLRADLAGDWTAVGDTVLLERLRAHHDEAVRYRVPHALASVISASLFKSVNAAAAKFAGSEASALVIAAVSGVGGIHMREATAALGEVGRGTLPRSEFLDRFGYRGFNEFELAAPPWREDPETLDRLVAAARDNAGDRPGARPGDVPGDQPCDNAAPVRAAARARLRAMAGRRWPLFSRQLDFVESHLRWRENGKVPMVLATHSIRLVVREAADRLVTRGRLATADDVFYLRLAELLDEFAGHPSADLAGAVERRRRTHELSAGLPLPEMIDAAPGSLGTISEERWRSLGVLPPGAGGGTGDRLVGTPGSPGRVAGRARIVLDPDDVEIDDGDVIVARGTDSAWAVLFYQADGVVVDVGGPMSHSSIAARELGIPCVVNVKGATSTIREGQRIVVDGDTGVVELSPVGE
jgi:pyruvate,water dikinase